MRSGMASGGSKLEEAHAIFQDLSEKYDSGKTPLILNGSAACLMAMGKFDEAEKELLEALGKAIRSACVAKHSCSISHHVAIGRNRVMCVACCIPGAANAIISLHEPHGPGHTVSRRLCAWHA